MNGVDELVLIQILLWKMTYPYKTANIFREVESIFWCSPIQHITLGEKSIPFLYFIFNSPSHHLIFEDTTYIFIEFIMNEYFSILQFKNFRVEDKILMRIVRANIYYVPRTVLGILYGFISFTSHHRILC